MGAMSKAEVLGLASKWERQSRHISVFFFSSAIALAAKHGRVAICLDECIDLRLATDTSIRIFMADATFSRLAPQDIPPEAVSLFPKFENGIRVSFSGEHMHLYLLS